MIVFGFRTYWLLCLSSFLYFSFAKQGDRHHNFLKHGINLSASAFLNAEANLFYVLFHALKPLVGQLKQKILENSFISIAQLRILSFLRTNWGIIWNIYMYSGPSISKCHYGGRSLLKVLGRLLDAT